VINFYSLVGGKRLRDRERLTWTRDKHFRGHKHARFIFFCWVYSIVFLASPVKPSESFLTHHTFKRCNIIGVQQGESPEESSEQDFNHFTTK